MKLLKGTIRPGIVNTVFDNGNIKAAAPGLFSSADDPSKLPPIMPWQIGSSSNSYTKPKEGDHVWIMNFSDNPLQLYWFRKDRPCDCENIDFTETNVEVLCNKDINGEWATIYLSDGSGWVISKGESIMQIRADGTILLNTGMNNRVIDINEQGISLGSEGKSSHPAAYGDVIVDIFNNLITLLKQIQFVTAPNPYTLTISSTISSLLPMIESKISQIVSSNVTLD